MNTLDVVEAALDPDRLSELVGSPVRATRIRIKPETSVVLSLAHRETGAVAGWARMLWPTSHAKASKARNRAAKLGRTTQENLVGGLLLQTGEVASDPDLGQRVHDAGPIHWPKHGDLPLLRYNPLRRVVVRDGDRVVRVSAHADKLGYPMHRLLAPHVPLPERLDDGADPHVSVQRFTGRSDLARTPDQVATRAAGAAMAALHSVAPGDLAETLAARTLSAQAQAEVHADLLDHLAPDLAARVRAVERRLQPLVGELVLSHGDASPDQVLVEGTQVWLTDFDRVCLAPRAADLGSYLAVCGDAAAVALLEGYREAGGALPTRDHMQAGCMASVMLRLMDPLRAAEPAWRESIGSSLAWLERMLS